MNKKQLKREIAVIRQLERDALAAALQDERAVRAERQSRRKAENRRKYELGGLVKEVGLSELPLLELKALLTWLATAHEVLGRKVFGLWTLVEIEDDTKVDDDPVRSLVVQFRPRPPAQIRQLVKKREFNFDTAAEVWRGKARERELRTELEKAGAHKYGLVLSRA